MWGNISLWLSTVLLSILTLLCNPYPEFFSSCKTETLPVKQHPIFHCSQSMATTFLLVSMNLTTLGNSCELKHTGFIIIFCMIGGLSEFRLLEQLITDRVTSTNICFSWSWGQNSKIRMTIWSGSWWDLSFWSHPHMAFLWKERETEKMLCLFGVSIFK